MNDSPEKISPLRRRMIEDMRMRKLSTKTQDTYIRAVRHFAGYLGRSPDTARDEDLRRYQLHCVDRGVSPITLNATITGLKFFFEVTLKHPELMSKMSHIRVARTLPVVLSREEASRLIESASTLKHRTALSVAYGAGLRVSEVCALKVGDIDSQRMLLRIEKGKGQKDRYALVPPILLERLRTWWRYARAEGKVLPGGYLFPGLDPVDSLSTRQLNRAVHEAAQAAHIGKRVTMHTLRHSFATHLLEQARQADLLPVPYYHVVFTLPAPISAIGYTNKEIIYGLLFDIAAETLRTIAADRKHLGARIGTTLVLHTWGSALTHHPHAHGIVPGGGLAPDADRWVPCKPGFFLSVRVLSRLFRRRFLEELENAHRAGQLKFFGEHIDLADAEAFTDWLTPLRQCEWVVYAKRPFAGPAQVLAYLSRYTHRVAISNSRLVALDDRGVTFRWKDYREHGRTRYKTMTLRTEEFMRRFLLHVLPSGFHRIRHYGLLANANRKTHIATARELLHQPAPAAAAEPGAVHVGSGSMMPTFVCRHCGAPMIVIETFTRAQHIRGPPGSSSPP